METLRLWEREGEEILLRMSIGLGADTAVENCNCKTCTEELEPVAIDATDLHIV